MSPREELAAVLQTYPGPTIRVPRSLLLDVLRDLYRGDADAIAADPVPLVVTGQGDFTRRYTPTLPPPAKARAARLCRAGRAEGGGR